MPLHFRFKFGPLVYSERLDRRPPVSHRAEPEPWPPPGVKPLRPAPRWKGVVGVVIGGLTLVLAMLVINKFTTGQWP